MGARRNNECVLGLMGSQGFYQDPREGDVLPPLEALADIDSF